MEKCFIRGWCGVIVEAVLCSKNEEDVIPNSKFDDDGLLFL